MERQRLSEESAARLLTRATELDSARWAGASIVELREAAREAGISSEAFEQALSEMRLAAAPAAQPRPRRWLSRLLVVAGAAAIMVVVLAVIARLVVSL